MVPNGPVRVLSPHLENANKFVQRTSGCHYLAVGHQACTAFRTPGADARAVSFRATKVPSKLSIRSREYEGKDWQLAMFEVGFQLETRREQRLHHFRNAARYARWTYLRHRGLGKTLWIESCVDVEVQLIKRRRHTADSGVVDDLRVG